MSRFLAILAATLCVLGTSMRSIGQDAAAQPAAAAASFGQDLPVLLDDDLSEPPYNRYKSIGPGESEWSKGKQWSIHAPAGFVLPIKGGRDALLSARLSFPRLEEGQKSQTRLGLVYANSQVGVLAFLRERTGDKTTSQIHVLKMPDIIGPIAGSPRTHEIDGDLPSGDWQFAVRAGAVTMSEGGKEIGRGTFDTHTVPIVGLAIAQPEGTVIVRRLTLRAAEFPAEFSDQQREQAIAASQLNQEAGTLLRSKKFAEAIAKGKEVIAAYKKLHGDKHHDTANALYNMSTILKQAGQTGDAVPFLEQSLAIRKELFGEDHPDTAHLEMEMTTALVELNRLDAAFPHCMAANLSFFLHYGSDHPATTATRQMLEKLPRPKSEDET